jgi:glyoxylase-like metal-dependent hydrolase (beta-lactamase superfamily II)
MLKVKRFINELMTSNCYVVYEDGFDDCVVVDPASKDCLNEIAFFKEHKLKPLFIILTHEHTDHTWGCNTLIEKYNAKVVCSKACAGRLEKEGRCYFLFYFNDTNYRYNVSRVDTFVEDIDFSMTFHDYIINFFLTPGHSLGSMCFNIGEYLFTGDTLMQYEPNYDKKRCTKEMYEKSVALAAKVARDNDYIVCPGHGEMFKV